jgi:hypothetical protein
MVYLLFEAENPALLGLMGMPRGAVADRTLDRDATKEGDDIEEHASGPIWHLVDERAYETEEQRIAMENDFA